MLKTKIMEFWKRVDALLKLRGKTRKELALACGFDTSNIGKGIKAESEPLVSTAYKISRYLEVSLEKLLGEETVSEEYDYSEFQKYGKSVRQLESLPRQIREPILEMIKEQYFANCGKDEQKLQTQ
ncbi:MAG: helix-turn-helix transcriptional regulator [Treponema sp.]|nr:helix-turn-helix transcriptional regulator [Treponema sp.]